MRMTTWIEERNPLKQGLKLVRSQPQRFQTDRIEERNPLKQGLKHNPKVSVSGEQKN